MARNLKAIADAAARRYGVPPSLFRRLIQQESGWNPDARNPSGATGLVQIHLPSHPDISEEQARDPAFALGWGARYLAAQKKRFGRWDLALAAYNAGPGNVEKHGGVPPFTETQNYVRNIMGRGISASPAVRHPRPPGKPTAATPPARPDLIASILRSNNDLIGVTTPDFISELLAAPRAPRLAAPSAALAPSAGAPVPQEQPSGGFNPQFKSALDRLLEAAQGRLSVTSGYRSPEHQARLYQAALRKYGSEQEARRWVAPPGKSKHGEGVAADLAGDLAWAKANAARFGLHFPLSNENWHVEPIGSRR